MRIKSKFYLLIVESKKKAFYSYDIKDVDKISVNEFREFCWLTNMNKKVFDKWFSNYELLPIDQFS